MIFRRDPARVASDVLVIRIQPGDGIAPTLTTRTPGPEMKLAPITFDFHYGEVFGRWPPEAYERLLLDAIHGDATLYARGDRVEQACDILTGHGRLASSAPTAISELRRGYVGPDGGARFIAEAGADWRTPRRTAVLFVRHQQPLLFPSEVV